MNKKTLKKLFIVIGVVLVITLVVWAIILISSRSSTGVEKLLDEHKGLNDIILTADRPLTDEQFVYGVQSIIPNIPLPITEQTRLASNLSSVLEQYTNQIPEIEVIPYFGDPAAIVTMKAIKDPLLLGSLLDNTFSRIYFNFTNEQSFVESEYIYKNNKMEQVYLDSVNPITVEDSELNILQEQITAEYALAVDDFIFTGDTIVIDCRNLSTTDALNMFDYTYQWLVDKNRDITIVLKRSTVLWANAHVDLQDSNYRDFYPAEELAPLFRMKYYYINNFFVDALCSTCKLYI